MTYRVHDKLREIARRARGLETYTGTLLAEVCDVVLDSTDNAKLVTTDGAGTAAIVEENRRLRDALAWYADEQNWLDGAHHPSPIVRRGMNLPAKELLEELRRA